MINHESSIPLYIQLAGLLEQAIMNKEYIDGEKLPSENELCKLYSVSRITVRQALSKLEQKNLVYSVHGKGTYVRVSQISQGLIRITSFEKTLEQKGLKGYTEIEQYTKTKIPESIRYMFDSDFISRLCLVGYANDMPLVYYNSYLKSFIAAEMYPIALKWEQEKKGFSTWDIYPEISIKHLLMEQKISAMLADSKIAKILKIAKGDPVMRLETHAYAGMELMEYKIAYYRADKYSFTVKRELENPDVMLE